jgi:hypothetical protein
LSAAAILRLTVSRILFLPLLALLLAAWSAAARGADGEASVRSGAVRAAVPLRSVQALRDAGVVKQNFDYSCGSAALATLLTYGLGDTTDEQWVLGSVFANASEQQRQTLTEKGLSLLDLQRVAEARGHKAQGFRIAADQLARLPRPVIVFVQPRGYRHFAVLKGVRGDRVHLADPSLGNLRMPLYRFLEMWADEQGRGIIFAVEPADGRWPDVAALAVAPTGGAPIEVLAGRQLSEIGKAYPLVLPHSLSR